MTVEMDPSAERCEEIIIAALTIYAGDVEPDDATSEVIGEMVGELTYAQLVCLFGSTIGFLSATMEWLAEFMGEDPKDLLRNLAVLMQAEAAGGA